MSNNYPDGLRALAKDIDDLPDSLPAAFLHDCADEIERLRDGLEDIRDYEGYKSAAHFRRRAAVILKEQSDG